MPGFYALSVSASALLLGLATADIMPAGAAQDATAEDSALKDAYDAAKDRAYSARGTAIVTGSTSEDQAIRLAKGEARRSIIESALGVDTTATQLTRDFRFVSSTIIGTARGITTDEVWTISKDLAGNTFIIHADLKANVMPLGASNAPRIKATLDRSSYKAGEEMTVTVEATEKAYVSVFNWDADNNVFRLYPYDDNSAVEISGTDSLVWPTSEHVMIAEPRVGRERDEELVMVVASREPFRADWLSASPAAEKVDGEVTRYEDFLRALSELDLGQTTFITVPFVVER